MKRQEQKTENTWNMQDLYANEELFDGDVKKLEAMMEEFSKFEGTLGLGVQQIEEAMKQYEELNFIYEKLHVYANQKYHEDTANAKYQKMSGEMQILETKLGQKLSWIRISRHLSL